MQVFIRVNYILIISRGGLFLKAANFYVILLGNTADYHLNSAERHICKVFIA